MSNLTHTFAAATENVVTVSDGYKTIEKATVVDMDTAVQLLTTKRQHRYSRAKRKKDGVLLTGYVLVCPYCQSKTPAYEHFVYRKAAKPRVSKPIIRQWAAYQLSLLNDSVKDTLELYPPMKEPLQYTCRKCGLRSKQGKDQHSIFIRSTKNTLEISCELDCLEAVQMLSTCPWLPNNEIRLGSHFREILVFNFRKGKAFIKYGCDEQAAMLVRDITSDTRFCEGSTILSLLSKHIMLKKAVRKAFLWHWHGMVPFTLAELSIDACIMMTRFIGYPRSFYDAIPYSCQYSAVDKSFTSIAAKLHKATCLPEIYHTSALPRMKSVRRVLFEHPGFFFYVRECEMIWSMVQDPNLLCRFLRGEFAYKCLSLLHLYPPIATFLSDICRVRSVKALSSLLCSDPEDFGIYAICYESLNAAQKHLQQRKWLQRKPYMPDELVYDPLNGLTTYSIPMETIHNASYSCRVFGFEFSTVRTTGACRIAGEKLHNCLGRMQFTNSSIVAAIKEGKIVAAIEVVGNHVIQAAAAYNESLKSVPGLREAFEKWCSVNHLCLDHCIFDADEEEFT